MQIRKKNFYNMPEKRRDYGKKVSDVTINNYIRNMKVFFNYLVETRELRKSPMDKINQIKVERQPMDFLSDADFNLLVNSLDISRFSEYRDYIIINSLIDTGMRIGECLLVEVSDIFKSCKHERKIRKICILFKKTIRLFKKMDTV